MIEIGNRMVFEAENVQDWRQLAVAVTAVAGAGAGALNHNCAAEPWWPFTECCANPKLVIQLGG